MNISDELHFTKEKKNHRKLLSLKSLKGVSGLFYFNSVETILFRIGDSLLIKGCDVKLLKQGMRWEVL